MSEAVIIRDEELFGLAMIPLMADWGVKRCNVQHCSSRPNTIVRQDRMTFGLCEQHYREAAQEGGTSFTLVWDSYDAFLSAFQRPSHHLDETVEGVSNEQTQG